MCIPVYRILLKTKLKQTCHLFLPNYWLYTDYSHFSTDECSFPCFADTGHTVPLHNHHTINICKGREVKPHAHRLYTRWG